MNGGARRPLRAVLAARSLRGVIGSCPVVARRVIVSDCLEGKPRLFVANVRGPTTS
jgi:hypothetical protein